MWKRLTAKARALWGVTPQPVKDHYVRILTGLLIVGGPTAVAAEATVGIPLVPDIPGVSQTAPPPDVFVANPVAQPDTRIETIAIDISGRHLRPVVIDTPVLEAKSSTVGYVSVLIGDRNNTYETFTTTLDLSGIVSPHVEFFESECGRYHITDAGNTLEAFAQIAPGAGTPEGVIVPPPTANNGQTFINVSADEIQIEPKTAAGWVESITIRDATMDGRVEIHKLRAGTCIVSGSTLGDGDGSPSLVISGTNALGPPFTPASVTPVPNEIRPINVRSQ